MKKVSILLISVFFLFSSCDEDGNIALPGGLSNEEVILGLKEALRVGTDSSVSRLTASNGYFADQAVKILLPEEVNGQISSLQNAISNANNPFVKLAMQNAYDLGVQPVVDDMVMSLNRSAEDAAKKATPIFVDAITGITINDGLNILNGPDTAATSYLRQNTFNNLFNAFQPDIDVSLSKDLVGNKSANDIFSTYVSGYNSVASVSGGMVNSISDVPLSEYVTNKGLNGLFLKVGEEEKNIRNNPLSRVTDILERVFGGG